MISEELQKNTPPGMAYWAGTGPDATTCAGCAHFRGTVRRSGIGKGTVQDGRCAEYMRMMRRVSRAVPDLRVPPNTPSCRHFEPRPQAAQTQAA